MRAQRLKAGGSNCRPPMTRPPCVRPQRTAIGAREHERLRRSVGELCQVGGQLLATNRGIGTVRCPAFVFGTPRVS